jgi:ATP-dependent protease ClpP protease subunit
MSDWVKSVREEIVEQGAVFVHGPLRFEDRAEYSDCMKRAVKAANSKDDPLFFYIDSEGGLYEVFEDFKLSLEVHLGLGNIKSLRTRVHTVGRAHSAAALLFILGNRREMFTESTLLFHYARLGWANGLPPAQGMTVTKKQRISEQREAFERGFRLSRLTTDEKNASVLSLFCERTGLPEDFSDSLFRQDRKMCAQEAFELGIATEILKMPKGKK